jgi:hypothetical protein
MLKFKKSFKLVKITRNSFILKNIFNFSTIGKVDLRGDSNKSKLRSETESTDFEEDFSKHQINSKHSLIIPEEDSEDFEIDAKEKRTLNLSEDKTKIQENLNNEQGDFHSHFIIDRNFKCK